MNAPIWFSNLLAASAQVGLLVMVAGLLPGAFRLRKPRVLLVYWTALLASSLLLPLLEPWRSWEQVRAGMPLRTETVRFVAMAWPTAEYGRLPLYEVAVFVLLAGIVVRLILLGFGLHRLCEYRRTARPLTPLPVDVEELQSRVGRTGSTADFCVSSAVDSPVTFGFVRPIVLLPARFPSMQARYQTMIACHELVHVRRHDWAQHLVEELLRALLWFHPAIVWLIARIRLTREQVVDAEVIDLIGTRKLYLEALLEIAVGRDLARSVPASPFLAERQLSERVALMLKEVSMSRTRLIASLTAMFGCLALAATLAMWSFPLTAGPYDTIAGGAGHNLQPCNASDPGCPNAGIVGGTVGGIHVGVTGGMPARVADGVGSGIIGADRAEAIGAGDGVPGGVPGEVNGGAIGGVPGAVSAQAGAAHRSKEGETYPKPVYTPTPPYPHAARNTGKQGTVTLGITVDTMGKVAEAHIVKALDPALDKSALDGVRTWRFKPATKDGKPVSVEIKIEVTFRRF